MKKISFIIPSFNVGGSEYNFIKKANYLQHSKYVPELVYWLEKGELYKHIKPRVSIKKIKGSNLICLLFAFINYFNKSKPEIVHTANYMIANIVLIARMFSSHKPKVIIGAESDFDAICNASKNPIDNFILRSLSKFFYTRSDKIICVSKGVKNGLLKELKLKESKIDVIYNGVLTKQHAKGFSELPDHHWYSNKEICLVCSIGRLSPEKGIYELVSAFIKVLTFNKNLRLLIIGEGSEENRIKKLISVYKIEKYVEIIGFKDDYYSYLDNSDIFVLNSFYEGMSNILAEAATTNTKIISTNCNYGPDEVLDGISESKLIDINNESQLVDAIIEFSNMKKVKRKHPPHLKNFYFEESMKKYIKTIKDLIN
jgi:glycosyltransferase involved in cell wall biosynthesis